MTQLSPHFALAELTHSDTALRLGIANRPNDEELLNLSTLATTVLEPARAACRVPLIVNDGFRCDVVNRAVGGVADSAHRTGCAADVRPAGLSLQEGFDRIRADDSIPFDQIILESGCIHLACAENGKEPRRQALIRHGEKGDWTYTFAEPLMAGAGR
jgi:hypothetical protein